MVASQPVAQPQHLTATRGEVVIFFPLPFAHFAPQATVQHCFPFPPAPAYVSIGQRPTSHCIHHSIPTYSQLTRSLPPAAFPAPDVFDQTISNGQLPNSPPTTSVVLASLSLSHRGGRDQFKSWTGVIGQRQCGLSRFLRRLPHRHPHHDGWC